MFRENAKRFGGRSATNDKILCNFFSSNEVLGRIIKMKKKTFFEVVCCEKKTIKVYNFKLHQLQFQSSIV